MQIKYQKNNKKRALHSQKSSSQTPTFGKHFPVAENEFSLGSQHCADAIRADLRHVVANISFIQKV